MGQPAGAREEPKMVTTTVSLEDATYQRLRHLAVDERTNVRELIREAITDLLARRGGR